MLYSQNPLHFVGFMVLPITIHTLPQSLYVSKLAGLHK